MQCSVTKSSPQTNNFSLPCAPSKRSQQLFESEIYKSPTTARIYLNFVYHSLRLSGLHRKSLVPIARTCTYSLVNSFYPPSANAPA